MSELVGIECSLGAGWVGAARRRGAGLHEARHELWAVLGSRRWAIWHDSILAWMPTYAEYRICVSTTEDDEDHQGSGGSLVDEEMLVEEISIDGMCGVY